MPSEQISLTGHIIDTLSLPKVLDEIVDFGASFNLIELNLGHSHEDLSEARLEITTDTEEQLVELIEMLRQHGANPDTVEDALIVEADCDGAFPEGFYSTTNLETEIRVDGTWLRVVHPEMDCGIVVENGSARTMPMSEVRRGMAVVMRGLGIRVLPLERPADAKQSFEFMSSDISSEKPKALLVDQVARQLRAVRGAGKRVLWVAGPAVVHTGAGPDLAALIRGGYVNAFFAGNGVAAHDIESNLYGTSLGVHLAHGVAAEHGHEHHIRAINELRKHGSFASAIDAGLFDGGIVYELVRAGADFVFGGSVRDDGPLPAVITDVLEVQKRLREVIWGEDGDDLVGFCIVVGTMLHGIATGNCLPASVPLACVDINQATVTKLMDRGSWQSIGIITDVGLFIRELAVRLVPDEVREPEEDAEVRTAGSRTRQ